MRENKCFYITLLCSLFPDVTWVAGWGGVWERRISLWVRGEGVGGKGREEGTDGGGIREEERERESCECVKEEREVELCV